MAITNFAYKGRGRVYLDGREIGNVVNLELSFSTEETSIKDYRTCAGGNYASSIDIDEANFSLTFADYSPDNIALAFFGSTSAIAAGAVTDESITAPADLASGADRYVRTAYPINTEQTVTVTSDPAGTTYTAGTDYDVRGGGIIIYGSGSISASAALLIDYTKIAATRVEALMSASVEREMIIEGLNCAQSGAPTVVQVYRAKPSPADAFQLITDDFAQATLTGKMDADTSKGSSVSQYFRADVATAVPA
jgi:hypothetical protein